MFTPFPQTKKRSGANADFFSAGAQKNSVECTPGAFKPVFSTFLAFDTPVLDLETVRDEMVSALDEVSVDERPFAAVTALAQMSRIAYPPVGEFYEDEVDVPQHHRLSDVVDSFRDGIDAGRSFRDRDSDDEVLATSFLEVAESLIAGEPIDSLDGIVQVGHSAEKLLPLAIDVAIGEGSPLTKGSSLDVNTHVREVHRLVSESLLTHGSPSFKELLETKTLSLRSDQVERFLPSPGLVRRPKIDVFEVIRQVMAFGPSGWVHSLSSNRENSFPLGGLTYGNGVVRWFSDGLHSRRVPLLGPMDVFKTRAVKSVHSLPFHRSTRRLLIKEKLIMPCMIPKEPLTMRIDDLRDHQVSEIFMVHPV